MGSGFSDLQRERYLKALRAMPGEGELIFIVVDAPTSREDGDWRTRRRLVAEGADPVPPRAQHGQELLLFFQVPEQFPKQPPFCWSFGFARLYPPVGSAPGSPDVLGEFAYLLPRELGVSCSRKYSRNASQTVNTRGWSATRP